MWLLYEEVIEGYAAKTLIEKTITDILGRICDNGGISLCFGEFGVYFFFFFEIFSLNI